MSVVHLQEIGLQPDQRPLSFDRHTTANKDIPESSIAQLLSGKNAASQAIGTSMSRHDSAASSQETNGQSSLQPSQESSLSSQEIPEISSIRKDIGRSKPSETVARAATANMIRAVPAVISSIHDQPDITNAAKSQQRETVNSIHRIDTTAGHKRTANGEIKSGSSMSPVNHLGNELSQLSSTSPQRSPHIHQLTQKLRTKLSYAALKVQNGWEKKSINELEVIAQTSPRLPSSSVSGTAGSPRRSSNTSPLRPGSRSILSPNLLTFGRKISDGSTDSSSSSEIDHTRNGSLSTQRPTLAPPVDLGSMNPRRTNQPNFKPSTLTSNPNSNLSDTSVASARQQYTSTPPTFHRPLGQKPSTAMEQDAIATLLNMSSPGNTQYRPSSQQASTPFIGNGHPKKSGLSIPIVANKIPNTDSIPVSPRKKRQFDELDLTNAKVIDEVLNMPTEGEVSESSSEDEEDIV